MKSLNEIYAPRKKDEIDCKITKRHFPRTNSQAVLEFIIEKDPNNYLR